MTCQYRRLHHTLCQYRTPTAQFGMSVLDTIQSAHSIIRYEKYRTWFRPIATYIMQYRTWHRQIAAGGTSDRGLRP